MVVRVRPVISRSPHTVVYKFPSIKLGRTVYCESGLELDYVYLLDTDHGDVITFQEQPGKIKYHFNDRLHKYTPDFMVIRPNKRQIVEVKPEAKASSEEYRTLFGIIEPICREAGYEFIVATDVKIRVQPRLQNIKLLWKYGRTPIYPKHQIYCQEFFSCGGDRVLGELFEFFARREEGRAIVFSLLFWGVIGIDVNSPINADASVYLPA